MYGCGLLGDSDKALGIRSQEHFECQGVNGSEGAGI